MNEVKLENIIKNTENALKYLSLRRFLLYKIAGLIAVIAIIGSGIWFFMNKDNTEEAKAGWYNDSWTRRAKITINSAYTQGDLTDFPVLISTTTTDISDVARGDGRDIIFTDSNGTKLYREIEKFDSSTGELVAWVKAPSVASSTDTILYMYYGNSSYDTATSTDSFNVWDDNFKGVWHLPNSSGKGIGDLNASTTDSTSNDHDGSAVSDPVGEAGQIGDAQNFDSNDYLSIPDHADFDFGATDSFTVELWAKGSAGATCIGNESHFSPVLLGPGFLVNCGSDPMFKVRGTDSGLVLQTNTTPNDGLSWVHYVAVRDTGTDTLYLYINGSLSTSTIDTTTGSLATSNNLAIGAQTNGGNAFVGPEDEVRISNTARSADYIRTSYNNQNSPSTFLSWATTESGGGPVAYWSFDEGYASTTYDRIGNNDGIIYSNATWVDGKFGKALSFDGVDDYVSVGSNFNISGDITISAWIKRKNANCTQDYILAGGGLYYRVDTLTGCTLRLYTDGANSWWTSKTILDTDWHHVVATVVSLGGGQVVQSFYIDGKIDVSSPATRNGSISVTPGSEIIIGGGAGGINGLLDNIKIYNRALTYSEVAEEYASGGSANSAGVSVGKSFNRGKSGDPGTITDGLVGYWKMDETSWNGTAGEVIDYSGMGNHGTSTNATSTTDQAKYGRSGGFDGVDDYIGTSFTDGFSSMFSTSFWVNFDNFNDTYNGTLAQFISGAPNVSGWSWFYNSGVFKIAARSNSNTFIDSESTGFVPAVNTWYNFATTWDSTGDGKVRFYVNGVLKYTSTGSSNVAMTGLPKLLMGSLQWTDANQNSISSDQQLHGYIDDVKIYNKALSADEITREYVSGPGPVGYWRFEERTGTTAYDLSGNFNNGTLTGGPVWDSGKVGGALRFDGVDDYVAVADNDAWDFTGGLFSISFYLNPATLTSQDYYLFISHAVDAGNRWQIYYDNVANNGIGFYSAGGSGALNFYQGSESGWVAGTWYHINLVRNGSNWNIYRDGVSIASAVSAVTLPTLATPLSIGRNAFEHPNYYFDGFIDEVKIYNYARTPRQIMQDYNGGGPVGYWKFDEGYASTTYDGSGQGNDGTLMDNTLWSDFGKFGKALSFDGVDDTVKSTVMDLSGSAITVTFWFKGDNAQSAVRQQGAVDFFVFPWSSACIHVMSNDGGTPGGISCDGNSGDTLEDGSWHYVTVTWQQNTTNGFKSYFDGNLVAQRTSSDTPISTILSQVYFGSYSGASEFTDGLIDEVKIYNYARTAEEIRQDYNAGSAQGGQGATLSIGNQPKQGKEYVVGSDGLVGYWKMDESSWDGTAGEVIDSSGAGNHGTSTNATSTTDQAKYGRSGGFDGSGDYVEIGTDIFSNSNFNNHTLCAWVNNRNLSSGQSLDGIVILEGAVYIAFDDDVDKFRGHVRSTVATEDIYSDNAINANQWYHLCQVYNENELALFLDAVKQGQTAENIGSPDFDGYSRGNNIGTTYVTTGAYFNGYIDDVKIYNRALSPDEITREYVTGPGPVGYWRFEEHTGTTANDVSGNLNTGTLTNGPVWDVGKVGGALLFDGVDDYVNIDSGLLDTLSISLWFKTNSSSRGVLLYQSDVAAAGVPSLFVPTILLQSDGKIRAEYWTGGVDSIVSTNALNNGAWHHVEFIGTSNSQELFVNGISNGSRAGTISQSWGSKLVIGTGYDNAARGAAETAFYYFNGFIDEVKVYNYARTSRQIAYDYNGGKPVGHWKFDRGSGGTAYDSAQGGNGNNGTIYPGLAGDNTATSTMWDNAVTGKINSALDFDGTDDYVSVANSSSIGITNPLTIEYWLKPDSWAANTEIVSKRPGASQTNYETRGNANGTICLYWYTSGWYGHCSLASFPASTWSHFTVTMDLSNNIITYKNGVIDNKTTAAVGLTADSGSLEIGGNSLVVSGVIGGEMFNGQIDDVRIYNYARTPEEVRIDYNNGAGVRF